MIERKKYLNNIKEVLNLNKSIFLTWARQVWKTSLLKSIWDFWVFESSKIFYINFDELAFKWFIEFENLQQFISYLENYFWINFIDFDLFLFDEIVRIKNFNIVLKSLIDKFDDKKFISTASWNYDFVTNVIDWLAWRVVKINVYPLDFKEFLLFKWKVLNLSNIDEKVYKTFENYVLEYLSFWWYPEVVLSSWIDNKLKILKSITDSVFEKDLRSYIKEEKFFNLEKLIIYIATNTWSLFSLEWLSVYLWIKLNDIKNFLEILEKAHLIFKLKPFYSNKNREYSSKQKIYINDFWIACFFLKSFSQKMLIKWADTEMATFLNLFFNKKILDSIYYYQKRNWSEIDFIYKRENRIYPIESKTSNNDNIPKVFNSFLLDYKDEIEYFIKTTTYSRWKRNLNWKKVFWVPFYDVNI